MAELNDLTVELESLIKSAKEEYESKKYSAAAEYYSEAAETQATINGEWSPENADLLYDYGCCLYDLAKSQFNVLATAVGTSVEPQRKKRKLDAAESTGASVASNDIASTGLIGDAIKAAAQSSSKDGNGTASSTALDGANKPLFVFDSDAEFSDSEVEEDAAEGDAEDEKDAAGNLELAAHLLSVARDMYVKKINRLTPKEKGKSNEEGETSEEGESSEEVESSVDLPEVRPLKNRVEKVYDTLIEVLVEMEALDDACKEARKALILKRARHPKESRLVAAAHYTYAAALDLACRTYTPNPDDPNNNLEHVDESMREKAARHMELAIASFHARMAKEEVRDEEIEAQVEEIDKRLKQLRPPATSSGQVQESIDAASDEEPSEEAVRGVLAKILELPEADQARMIADLKEKANDLSGLVKNKRKGKAAGKGKKELVTMQGKGKRKAE